MARLLELCALPLQENLTLDSGRRAIRIEYGQNFHFRAVLPDNVATLLQHQDVDQE